MEDDSPRPWRRRLDPWPAFAITGLVAAVGIPFFRNDRVLVGIVVVTTVGVMLWALTAGLAKSGRLTRWSAWPAWLAAVHLAWLGLDALGADRCGQGIIPEQMLRWFFVAMSATRMMSLVLLLVAGVAMASTRRTRSEGLWTLAVTLAFLVVDLQTGELPSPCEFPE